MYLCWCGRNWSTQGKTHHLSNLQVHLTDAHQLDHLFNFCQREPGQSWDVLSSTQKLTQEGRSPPGLSFRNFMVFLTSALEGKFCIGCPLPHSWLIWQRVLPKRVLWSACCSLARYFTGNFSHLSRDWWKLTYLLHNITFGWMLSESSSIRYLWVLLSTLKQILIATFQAA